MFEEQSGKLDTHGTGSSRGSEGKLGKTDLRHIYPSFASMDRDWSRAPSEISINKRSQRGELQEPPCCSYRLKTSEKHAYYDNTHRLTFRSLYMGMVRHTTAHGLPQIHIAKGCIKKFFWILLTLGLTATWLWNAQDVLSSFLKNDVTIKYDIRSEPKLLFPGVTICNQNVARASELEGDVFGTELLSKPPPKEGPGDDDKFDFEPWERPHGGGDGLGIYRSDDAIRKDLIQEYLAGLDTETKIRYGHAFFPLVASCRFGGFTCYNSTFQHFYDATYGNCFTFNTGTKGRNSQVYAFATGPDNGLSIEFAIEQREYLAPVTAKAGIRVVIHPAGTAPFPVDHGIDIGPGRASSVGVRKVLVSRLGGRFNDCVNTSLSNSNINAYEQFYPWTRYSMLACQKTCYQQQLMNKCKCIDKDYPYTGKAFKSIENATKLALCNASSAQQDICRIGIFDRFTNGSLNCKQCEQPCKEEYYALTISSSLWPSDNYMETLREQYEEDEHVSKILEGPDNRVSSEMGLLEIYYESLNLEEMIEQPAYEVSQFIADIGGSVGLWLGASVMTIFEFIEFFLDSFVLFLAKCCRGPDKTNTKNTRPKQNGHRKNGNLPPNVPEIRVSSADPQMNGNHYATQLDDLWHQRKLARAQQWPGHGSLQRHGDRSMYGSQS